MTLPKKPRNLTAPEVGLIRLIARGHTDAQIADFLGVRIGTVRGRINTIYHLLGITIGEEGRGGGAGITRLRLVVWAYENGIVGSKNQRVQAASQREKDLAEAAFEMLRQLVHKRPYPVVREQAVAIIREVDAEATIEAYEAKQAAA